MREHYESAVRALVSEFEALLREEMLERGGTGKGAAPAAVAVVAAIEGFFRLAAGAPSCVPAGSAAGSIRAIAEGFVAADAAASGGA